MRAVLRSAWVWFAFLAILVVATPCVALVRLFDRDPARYRTGRLLRRFAWPLTKVNPLWKIAIVGADRVSDPRRPYVAVANHQSFADVPIISRLPWEMKWVAKRSLFRVPFLGWMMRLAGDIPVNRRDKQSRAAVLPRMHWYLQRRCSVMLFPEGARSSDGEVHDFADGAFRAAIEAHVPILPLAISGSRDCLPRGSWLFTAACDVRLQVLPPVETTGLTLADAPALRDQVRSLIAEEVSRKAAL